MYAPSSCLSFFTPWGICVALPIVPLLLPMVECVFNPASHLEILVLLMVSAINISPIGVLDSNFRFRGAITPFPYGSTKARGSRSITSMACPLVNFFLVLANDLIFFIIFSAHNQSYTVATYDIFILIPHINIYMSLPSTLTHCCPPALVQKV